MVASFKKTGREPTANPFAIENFGGFSESRALPCCIDRKNLSRTRNFAPFPSFSPLDEDRTPLGDSKAVFSIRRVLEISYSLHKVPQLVGASVGQCLFARASSWLRSFVSSCRLDV